MHALVLFLAFGLGKSPEQIEFTCEQGNYKLTYPRGWRKVRSPEEHVQLALEQGANTIYVSAVESAATLEELREGYKTAAKTSADSLKEVSRKNVTVAGERAETTVLVIKEAGVLSTDVYLTVWTHQGLAYQVAGAHVLGNADLFKKDYQSILDSFGFLAERKAWLRQHEGKPARTAMLGGLASFELNRPRWVETTFDEFTDYSYLETVTYKLMSNGAWVTVRAREASGDAAAELEALRLWLTSNFRKAQVSPTTVNGLRGPQPAFEMTGEANDYQYLTRATVFVEDGLAVQVYLQCLSSQLLVTFHDWEQLVGKFVLQSRSKPTEPPAFPVRGLRSRQAADPGLEVFLSQATRLLANQDRSQVLALSPDGKAALRQGVEGAFIETFATRKREALKLAAEPRRYFYGPARPDNVVWSRDGNRIAEALEEEVLVSTVDGKNPRRYKGLANELCFGPTGDELLLCVPARAASEPTMSFRHASSRLERLDLKDDSRRVLVDFPLSRVSRPTVSPDGKWIALVTNRDYPRTAAAGGHVYVCAADGAGLRQLTRDPEEVLSLAWDIDGESLYAVRRLAVGEKGAVGSGGSADLYRVSLATGEAVNLTRSGRINQVWTVEKDLVIEIQAWDLPPGQRGLFRISPSALEKATASRPSPPIADRRALARGVAARLDGVVEGKWQSAAPTPELLRKLAQAFAEAVQQDTRYRLDFSAASLERLPELAGDLDLGAGRERSLVLGFGAYYGETLRKLANAEWHIKDRPFADWVPAGPAEGNAFVDVILPFSDSYRLALGGENVWIRNPEDLPKQADGRKILLVYPPTYAEETLRAATPKDYHEAQRRLDAGEVKSALELLAQELERNPRNGPLAQEVIAICESARMPDLAKALTRRAVEAGNEVPELLTRHADELAKAEPKQALDLYRRAVRDEWASSQALLKLGRHYAQLGQLPLAESCWRRAYRAATDSQQREIRKLLGIPEADMEAQSPE